MEPISLTLLTDDESDKVKIIDALTKLSLDTRHTWQVYSQADADLRAETQFKPYPNLSRFRMGHPCWRKITDPLLFAEAGSEIIVLDPDLYFPNFFKFEPTPVTGIYLMWQPPSCLLPHETVMRAYNSGIPLAHHVDIGVAQLRNNLDMAWLDQLIKTLGGADIPRVMHVEAIVWAALAMKVGGGYYDPSHWYCWQYRQWKRLLLKLGVSGTRMLAMENIKSVKCFHASGIAKWWVKSACERNLFPAPKEVSNALSIRSFIDMPLAIYEHDQRIKNLARKLGYYAIMKK
ncbi:hypothetical protein DIC66_04550 [Rhodoferax lacus]|uniref:Uncharacterized protein n=2 Tax=Rhodoferax lacus TaxID=2184758 RepID=A0A3E1RHB2_9BURK|nr:hypothetical protein DIC66_04550 [Rhodoferax lacus]